LHPNKWLKFVYSGIGYVYTYIDEYNIEIYTTCVPKYPQKAKFRETSRDRELGWNIHGLWLIGCTTKCSGNNIVYLGEIRREVTSTPQ
jgi:hypothetical protein